MTVCEVREGRDCDVAKGRRECGFDDEGCAAANNPVGDDAGTEGKAVMADGDKVVM